MENNIYTKLAKIQKTLNVPKNQRNSFGNYNYRSCEDILEAVKPLLGDLILLLADEVVNIGDRNYVRAEAVLTDGEKQIKVSAFACEASEKKGMDSAQITGAASSYARKYALNGLFAIDDEKDADTKDNREIAPTSSTELQSPSLRVVPASNSPKCQYCGTTNEYHRKGCPNE